MIYTHIVFSISIVGTTAFLKVHLQTNDNFEIRLNSIIIGIDHWTVGVISVFKRKPM